jgi:hypothetical protein
MILIIIIFRCKYNQGIMSSLVSRCVLQCTTKARKSSVSNTCYLPLSTNTIVHLIVQWMILRRVSKSCNTIVRIVSVYKITMFIVECNSINNSCCFVFLYESIFYMGLAHLRYSIAFVLVHCISCQEIGIIAAPNKHNAYCLNICYYIYQIKTTYQPHFVQI